MAWVITQPKKGQPRSLTGNIRSVKNMGWLFAHAREVESFVVDRQSLLREFGIHTEAIVPGARHALIVFLRGQKMFLSEYSGMDVLVRWLDRPSWRGLPIIWYGDEVTIGPELYKRVFGGVFKA